MLSGPVLLLLGAAPHARTETGVASWYGAWHAGKIQANGQPFDPTKLTAASRTWPLGTHLRVCNLRNGRCTSVLVTDRGPVPRHRIIDLSRAAAARLDFVHAGLARVRIREVRR